MHFIQKNVLYSQKAECFPGGTPLYKPQSYVPSHRVGFQFAPFWSENDTLCPWGLGQVGFSRELSECMNIFIVLIPNE